MGACKSHVVRPGRHQAAASELRTGATWVRLLGPSWGPPPRVTLGAVLGPSSRAVLGGLLSRL
eukprot:4236763-Pyramimonas_sp.AAC.1